MRGLRGMREELSEVGEEEERVEKWADSATKGLAHRISIPDILLSHVFENFDFTHRPDISGL